MPALWKIARLWNASGEQEFQPAAPVAPVGETHDRAGSHPQHLVEDHFRIIEKGQRLAEDNVVKTAVRVVGQSFLQVALAHAEAAAHACQYPFLAELNPSPFYLLGTHQMI